MSVFDSFFPTAFSSLRSGGASEIATPAAPSGGCGCGCHAPAAPDSAAGDPGSAGEALLSRTLNAWNVEKPDALGLFHELGLDACCGGERSLGDACRRHGLDPRAVLERLRSL